MCRVGILCQSCVVSGGCVLARIGFLPAACSVDGNGGTGGRFKSCRTLMLSFRPGEKLYVRCFSGFLCNFFESLEDLLFLSFRLLLRSGPAAAAVISATLCLPRFRCRPTSSCIASSISAPLRVGLGVLFLRKGQTPIFPFVLSTAGKVPPRSSSLSIRRAN